MNLPNALTLLRVLLIPVFIFFLSSYTPFDIPLETRAIIAACVFFAASMTDWLDGYIARSTGQITRLGKLFDPIADKLLTSSALILLVSLHGEAPAWIAIVIIGREFAVTGLRAAASSAGHVIPATEGGKAKMVFQTIAIIALLLDIGVKSAYLDMFWIGTVALWISMILAVISGVQYFAEYWDKIGLSGDGGGEGGQ